MTRYDMNGYEREREEELRKQERIHREVIRHYRDVKCTNLSDDFLCRLKYTDDYMYKKFLNKEDIPKDVVNWFYIQVMK